MSLDDFHDGIIDLIGGAESLWDQLQRSAAHAGPSSGHPVARSRVPISLSAVSLTVEVRTALAEAGEEHGFRTGSVRGDFSALLATLVRRPDPDVTSWWADACRDWIARAKMTLGLTVPTRWLRGLSCPACTALTARSRLDGEWVVAPALMVLWGAADEVWIVESVHCRACGTTWDRDGGLADLAISSMSST